MSDPARVRRYPQMFHQCSDAGRAALVRVKARSQVPETTELLGGSTTQWRSTVKPGEYAVVVEVNPAPDTIRRELTIRVR